MYRVGAWGLVVVMVILLTRLYITSIVTTVIVLANQTLASSALIFGASEGLYMCHIAPCRSGYGYHHVTRVI